MNKHFVSAIIVSAGNSSRMGGINKQFLEFGGMSVIACSVNAFQKSPLVDEIIIVTREQDISAVKDAVKDFSKVKAIVTGGSTRQQSVFNGIKAASEMSEFVAIHDGARPLVSQTVIADTLNTAYAFGAAATGVRVKDTVKVVDENNDILSTPNRETLRFVQTPQVFSKELLS